ncbi:MAG: MFS transporter [Thermoplasmata archaeon]|nr:MAG: MFS transporter [Thermoplasmata archaeon]
MNFKRFVIYLCAFIGPLGGNAVLALIPTLQATFYVAEAEVLMAITLFMLPFAIGQLFTSSIARVYGYQNTMIAGYLIYAIGSALGGAATDITIFLGCRIIQGIGFALVTPVTIAILGDLTEPGTRGRYIGLLNAAIGGGIFLGPIIAGFFAVINWRLAFYTLGILAICVAYIFWFTFKDMKFDTRPTSASILIFELKSVLKSPKVILLCTSGFLTFFSFIGVISFTAIYISGPPLNMSEYKLGLIIASSGLAQIILALPGGLIVDWIGRFKTGFIGFSTGGVIALSFTHATKFSHFLALAALIGFSAVMIWAVLVTLSVEIIPDKKIYVASIFNSLRFFGFAAAPIALVGVYTSAGIGGVYFTCACTFIINIIILSFIAKS